ncbi:MAG: hypothetical protein M3P04_03455 [Actinomycetota bacterium]|nr:hypothetical protein [Actinomycetota bacterium]
MTATTSRFEATIAPCGKLQAGEQQVAEDQEGLITVEMIFTCGCRRSSEEFHDGSFHRMAVHHRGKVLLDEELRGE